MKYVCNDCKRKVDENDVICKSNGMNIYFYCPSCYDKRRK